MAAPCFIGSGCPFIEGYILYNMIKQDAVGVWTPRTPPVAPALFEFYTPKNPMSPVGIFSHIFQNSSNGVKICI